MPCYVDPLFNTEGWSDQWPFPEACHLMADTDEELHALAARLGLKRAWHQPRPPHSVSHYDLTRRKRRAAVMAGAIEVDRGFMPEREVRRPSTEVHTHGLERTNPKGEKFIGRCRYCGKDNLPMSAALDPCEKAPGADQQILDALRRGSDEPCCAHGVALDVHCCGEGGLPYPGCHSGFLFNPESCRCKL